MATLILPSLLLMTLDGIIIYLKDSYSINRALRKMFLPASGAFFINYILQNAILANTENLIRLEDIVIYIWKTRINLYRKPLTPAEKLKAASLIEFKFESEYARILSVFTIGLSFSLFSPIISICTILYLFIKYYVDRYQVEYLYSHQIEMKNFYKENEGEEVKSVFDSDFLSHLRLIELLIKLVTVVICIFLFVVFIFYATKVNNISYLPHVIFSLLLLIMSVSCCLYLHYSNEGHFILSFAKYETLNLDEPVENIPPVERAILEKAYEYEHSFKFMKELPEVTQEPDEVEELENIHL
jgi:type III secretory pathway component EscS